MLRNNLAFLHLPSATLNSVFAKLRLDPQVRAERLSLEQDLRNALAQLPPTHRAVLLLVKRDGFSYEEAAQKMKLNVSTVTSYLFDARARMKMLLKHRKRV